ncbi:M20/M25/M40 family metallo-hydrolase [Paracoccus marcusii]|uniref:M20/M25/M40 family metallo-hydrolase n=1 Tax=Paracoccus marcusii TaxID=59779 RepID=UPI002ED5AAE3|nr:M20/M25/M40 family metallo-hydrolase [Paracoccus marcusii]
MAGQMVEAGLKVREDAVGNVFGRLEGRRPDLAPILVGSHLDSVPNGGRFDGPAGVVAGIETAFLFRDLGLQPDRPVEVVALIEEEGTRFGGGLFGSRLLTGQVDPAGLDDLRDDAGVSAAQAMTDYGLDPARAGQAALAPGSVHAFLELHIEQGPVLETEVRTSPSSTASWVGAAARDRARSGGPCRHDSDGSAPRCADGRGRHPVAAARSGAAGGAAVGADRGQDGGAARWCERDPRSGDLHRRSARPAEEDVLRLIEMVQGAVAHAQGNGLTAQVERQLYAAPTPLSGQIHAALSAQAEALGVSHRVMVSGAGRDAMIMAGFAPTGLIFVPSRGGISHAPEEWTDYAQLARGIDVIFATIRQMAGAMPR